MEKELKSLNQKWVVRVCKSWTTGNIFVTKMYLSILQNDSCLLQLISQYTHVTALKKKNLSRKNSTLSVPRLALMQEIDISAVCV